jgi:type IV pilus assembly protein PilX
MNRLTAPSLHTAQRGATLVTVLILLLVMTLLGLVSMRSTLMDERMSANMRDRSLAFQAAEAALRAGEDIAATRITPAAGCVNGRCGFPVATAAPVWENDANWNTAPAVDFDDSGLVSDPQYIVELIADRVPPRGACTTTGDISETVCTGFERRYRITARSQDTGRARTIVQSIYAVP